VSPRSLAWKFGGARRDGYLQGVLPYAAFECLACRSLQRTDASSVVVNVAALERVLEAPGAVEISRLEESRKASIDALIERALVCFEEVLPVHAPLSVLLYVGCSAETLCHLGDAEVIV
jgi:hypothetical protein